MPFLFSGHNIDEGLTPIYRQGAGGIVGLNIAASGTLLEHDGSTAYPQTALPKPAGIEAGDTIVVTSAAWNQPMNPLPAEQLEWTKYAAVGSNFHGIWYRTATADSDDDFTVSAKSASSADGIFQIQMYRMSLPCEPYQSSPQVTSPNNDIPIEALPISADGADFHLITGHFAKQGFIGSDQGAISLTDPAWSMYYSKAQLATYSIFQYFWGGFGVVGTGLGAVGQELITHSPHFSDPLETQFVRWRTT